MSNSFDPDEAVRYGPAQHERDAGDDERWYYLGGTQDDGEQSIEYGQFPHYAPETDRQAVVDDADADIVVVSN